MVIILLANMPFIYENKNKKPLSWIYFEVLIILKNCSNIQTAAHLSQG